MKRPRLIHPKNLILVGLTGGIACGKSTVKNIFERLGTMTIDTDAIARGILTTDTAAGKAVIRRFGRNVVDPRGALDRGRIAEIVFSSPRERKWLESITHPAITREVNRRLREFSKRGGKQKKCVVIDIPLLFEAGFQSEVDRVIVVCSPRRQQMERMKFRKMPTDNALARINAQWPLSRKKARADHVIVNDGSKKELEIKVKKLWRVLTNPEYSI